MSTTQTLAAFASEIAGIPDDIVPEARRLILDTIGCALGGWTTLKGRLAVELAADLGGAPEASILGGGRRVSADHASFANGELANALDADAGFLNVAHIVPIIVPAVLAVGEAVGASGRQVLDAAIVGLEIAGRLALAMTPMREGYDGTRTRYVVGPVCGYGYGAIGAAAGAGRLRGLDAERMAHAFGLAAYYAPVPSVLQWLRATPFSMVKYAPMGWTAQAGATAALLAAKGYTADTSVLDSREGFAQYWGSDRFEPEYLLRGLGSDWDSIRWLNYKSEPLCNLYRPHVWLLSALRRDERLSAGDIEEVILRMHAPAGADRPYAGEPPTTPEGAHMSAEFGVALALTGVPRGPRWADLRLLDDPAFLGIMRKVRIEGNPQTTEITYRSWTGPSIAEVLTRAPAEVEVRARGRTFRRSTEYSYGDMWAPREMYYATPDLIDKFMEMTRPLLPEDRRNEVVHLVLNDFDRLPDLEPLLRLLRGAGAPSRSGANPQREGASHA
ncbi:MAG TPA: MmgE/PrpD family protein [bacterium]|nr:MmgE/PrpD family protein [bacterium]